MGGGLEATLGADRGMMGASNTQGPYQHPIHTMLVGEYEERPRPNLQNVIQKLREGSVSANSFLKLIIVTVTGCPV